MENELKKLIDPKERVLYEGRPSKKCFIFESIFNPLMPFAILWALIDGFFILSASNGFNTDSKAKVIVVILNIFFF